jgi:hypothetical protein
VFLRTKILPLKKQTAGLYIWMGRTGHSWNFKLKRSFWEKLKKRTAVGILSLKEVCLQKDSTGNFKFKKKKLFRGNFNQEKHKESKL